MVSSFTWLPHATGRLPLQALLSPRNAGYDDSIHLGSLCLSGHGVTPPTKFVSWWSCSGSRFTTASVRADDEPATGTHHTVL